MDNSTGFAALQAQISKIRALEGFAKDVAPEVAEALEGELERQIASGTAPDGTPWKAAKDGHAVLRGAAKALNVGAIGTTVIARLVGPEARHHLGRARGGVTRQILPSKGIPAPVVRAIRKVVTEHFEERMGAKS